MCVNDVCVKKLNWMENGWMDWIEWMWKVDVESGAVPNLTQVVFELWPLTVLSPQQRVWRDGEYKMFKKLTEDA